MRYKVVWMDGGKKIKCAYLQCGRMKQGISWQPRFTSSEARINNVLMFCQKSCYDAHYGEYPISVPEKKSEEDIALVSTHVCS